MLVSTFWFGSLSTHQKLLLLFFCSVHYIETVKHQLKYIIQCLFYTRTLLIYIVCLELGELGYFYNRVKIEKT